MQQMSLSLDPGLEGRYSTLRECLATQVYQRGLVTVSGRLDMAPSKLTEKLAGIDSAGRPRGITVDELEEYLKTHDDRTPILYLVAKYCRDPKLQQAEAMAALAKLAEQLPALMQAAGLGATKKVRS